MFGRGVGAAAVGEHVPHRIQPVVVAGHDTIEHRPGILSRGGGVVVDDVHDDLESRLVEPFDHRPVFADTRNAVGVARVAALRDSVVPRIVAPVESVHVPDREDRGLLGVRIRCRIGDHRGHLSAGILRHCRDVERREQVNVGEAGLGELTQVRHSPRSAVRERHELAAIRLRDARVADAEIPDVQLVGGKGSATAGSDSSLFPPEGHGFGAAQVDHQAALAVDGQPQGVRIGHETGLDVAG